MPWLRTSSKSFCALSPNRDDACACATGGDAGVGPGIGCPFAFATGGALGAAAGAEGAASSRASGRRNASAVTRPITRTASPPINPSVRTRMRATRSPSRAYTGRWFFSGSRYAPLFVSLTSLSPPSTRPAFRLTPAARLVIDGLLDPLMQYPQFTRPRTPGNVRVPALTRGCRWRRPVRLRRGRAAPATTFRLPAVLRERRRCST